jgi:hypothetical protein
LCVRGEPLPVVFDEYFQSIVKKSEPEQDLRGASVAHGVVEDLLHGEQQGVTRFGRNGLLGPGMRRLDPADHV